MNWNNDEVLLCKRNGAPECDGIRKGLLGGSSSLGWSTDVCCGVHLFVNRAWIFKVGAKNKTWAAAIVIIIGLATIAVWALCPTVVAKA